MFKGLINSIKEDNGQASSTRFIMYATGVVILGTYLFHNILSALKGGDFIDFPMNSVMVLGIVLGGKVTQKFAEFKGTNKKESNQD